MYKLLLLLLQDNNGTIENEELRGFLKDLLELVKKVGSHIYKGYRKVKSKLKCIFFCLNKLLFYIMYLKKTMKYTKQAI
jgi:hypothetical protein